MSKIKELIEQMTAGKLVNVQIAKVSSVDEDACSCECKLVSGVDLFDVSLKSIIDNKNGIVIIPKVGSLVLVSYIENNSKNAFVVAFDEVDKITIASESIVINGGDNKGLVKLEPLVDKINALENQLNNILNVLKTTTIPLAPTGTYPFAPLYASINNIAPVTTESDLENTKVKH